MLYIFGKLELIRKPLSERVWHPQDLIRKPGRGTWHPQGVPLHGVRPLAGARFLWFSDKFLKISCVLILLLFTIRVPVALSSNQQQLAALTGFPHVQGEQLIDGNNQPLLLRGAMIESSFAYLDEWNAGVNPTTTLNKQTFAAMRAWGMNALRINISQWIEQEDKTGTYGQKLQQVVGQATQAGLYVVIDFHDDVQSGASGAYADGMLHKTSLNWWKSIAQTFRNNPQVMFDLINEPLYPDWCSWLYGGNAQGRCNSSITNPDIVGFVTVIKAIRSVGAKQIIVVEPGKAGGSSSEDGGWVNFDPSKISDSSILYSKHEYQNVISGNPTSWDKTWGVLLGHYPLYYGEWAVLPNPAAPAHCQGLTSENADAITNTFLNYLRSRNASWTYWDFEPNHLVTDFTSYAPTSFQSGTPWTCPNAPYAGAGLDIQRALLGQQGAAELSISSTTPPHTSIFPLEEVAGGQAPTSCGQWSAVASPNAISSDYLTGVSAVANNNVWDVGYYNTQDMNPTVHIEQLIEHWNGSTWNILSTPVTGARYNYLDGVEALAANNVWAVGSYLPTNALSRTLIEHWNGTTWSIISSPNVAPRNNYLQGVAAISPQDMWVVGYASDSSGSRQTLIEHWNGTSWSVISSPNGSSGNSYLNNVAAVSANDVWAVGSYYPAGSNAGQTLIEHWNGTQWSVVTSPNGGTLGSSLASVAVVATNNVWAVGSAIHSGTPYNFSQTLIEHWDGTRWSVIASPNVGSNWNLLHGIAAVSANNMWAVGDSEQVNGSKSAYVALFEQWNGTQWRVMNGQNVGSLYNYPQAMTKVLGTNQLWMVGNFANTSGPSSTLTEFYC